MNTHVFKVAPIATLVISAIFTAPTVAKTEINQSPISNNSVMIVTAPVDSPLTITTSPKTPRQPVPASDGSDYLKRSQAFHRYVTVVLTEIRFFVACLGLVCVF